MLEFFGFSFVPDVEELLGILWRKNLPKRVYHIELFHDPEIVLGLRPPYNQLGVLLRNAQGLQNISLYPWLLITGAFVILSVISFNTIGDGLRDAFNFYTVTRR